jgi:hypothetical protein
MTDHSNQHPDDIHPDNAAENHEHDLASSNVTWEGEPPVDDFHVGEETATVSEETEMVDDESAYDSSAGQKTSGRKSMIVPLAAGVGGLLIVGAVLYWQFGMSSPIAPMPGASIPPLSTQAPAVNAPADKAVENTTNDIAATTALAPVSETPSQAAPSPSEIVALSPKPDAVSTVTPPTPAAPAADPVIASMAAPLVAATAPAKTNAASAPVVSSPATQDATIDERLSVLTTHVEDLQKNLTQTSQQLSQVSAMLSDKNTGNGAGNSAFDDRLTKIEQKLAQMSERASSRSSVLASDESTFASSPPTLHKSRITHKKKNHVKQASRSKRSSPTMVMLDDVANDMAMAGNSRWVLRAATPDEAWVSADSTSRDLRHLQVGDTLTGIGTIKAIHQNGNAWVVEGSEGTIQ